MIVIILSYFYRSMIISTLHQMTPTSKRIRHSVHTFNGPQTWNRPSNNATYRPTYNECVRFKLNWNRRDSLRIRCFRRRKLWFKDWWISLFCRPMPASYDTLWIPREILEMSIWRWFRWASSFRYIVRRGTQTIDNMQCTMTMPKNSLARIWKAIRLSRSFQITVGLILASLAYYDFRRQDIGKLRANRLILCLNYFSVVCVFIITVLNIFIASFGVNEDTKKTVQTTPAPVPG